jgi:hypothetical protein
MRLAISVAWGVGGKRNHLGDSVLAKVKPARYPVSPDATGYLINRQFGLQHCRLGVGMWQRWARVPLAPRILLNYLEAGKDEHREPIDAIDHARISPEPAEQAAESGRELEIHISSHGAVPFRVSGMLSGYIAVAPVRYGQSWRQASLAASPELANNTLSKNR